MSCGLVEGAAIRSQCSRSSQFNAEQDPVTCERQCQSECVCFYYPYSFPGTCLQVFNTYHAGLHLRECEIGNGSTFCTNICISVFFVLFISSFDIMFPHLSATN